MYFKERFDEIMSRTPLRSTWRLWLWTIVYGAGIYCVVLWYLAVSESAHVDVVLLNKAFANTGLLLIAWSFLLSGVCYFWNFLDSKIVYRKYAGLVGFGFVLAHGLTSLWIYSFSGLVGDRFEFYAVWDVFGIPVSNVVAFAFGLVGLLVFTFMAAISNQHAVHELGGKRWRALLRLGYFAMIFGVIHFSIKNMSQWSIMIQEGFPNGFVPMNLIVAFVVLVSILLRLTLWWALYQKKRKVS